MSKTARDEAGGPAIDELLITASPYGMRAAAVAAGNPVAFFIEPRAKPSRIGDLHVARPLGRMKGIDACIVDIGERRGGIPSRGTWPRRRWRTTDRAGRLRRL